MTREEYAERLKHPEWRKLRLEMLEASAWRCCICGREDSMLHVHHQRYQGDEPWDTEPLYLKVMCPACHSHEKSAMRTAISELNQILDDTGYTSDQIFRLGEALCNFGYSPEAIVGVLTWMAFDFSRDFSAFDSVDEMMWHRKRILKEGPKDAS